jgi:hypothetical protein
MHVRGRQAQRWAFLSPFKLDNEDGSPYIDRLRLLTTPVLSAYIHRIHGPDLQADPHNHPGWFISLILAGFYEEEIWDHPLDRHILSRVETVYVRFRSKYSLRMMRRSQAHKIVRVEGLLWTLVITGPRYHDWGFWTKHGYVSWKDYK